MWQIINTPETLIFGVALAMMLLLGLVECALWMMGASSDWLHSFLPDSLGELGDVHSPDVAMDLDSAGTFLRFLSWLYLGRLPVLIWLVVFLSVFGTLGSGVQAALYGMLGCGAHAGRRFVPLAAQRRNQRATFRRFGRPRGHYRAGQCRRRARRASPRERRIRANALCHGMRRRRRGTDPRQPRPAGGRTARPLPDDCQLQPPFAGRRIVTPQKQPAPHRANAVDAGCFRITTIRTKRIRLTPPHSTALDFVLFFNRKENHGTG